MSSYFDTTPGWGKFYKEAQVQSQGNLSILAKMIKDWVHLYHLKKLLKGIPDLNLEETEEKIDPEKKLNDLLEAIKTSAIVTSKEELTVLELIYLPKEIKYFVNLKTLHLSDCTFEKSPNSTLEKIPSEITQLSKLETLSIRSSSLTSLPSIIGRLSNLKTLDLANNQLRSLPSSMKDLSSLTDLDLSRNQFSSIPEEIAKLLTSKSQLKSISLLHNPLESISKVIRPFIRNFSIDNKTFINVLQKIDQKKEKLEVKLKRERNHGNKLKDITKKIADLEKKSSDFPEKKQSKNRLNGIS